MGMIRRLMSEGSAQPLPEPIAELHPESTTPTDAAAPPDIPPAAEAAQALPGEASATVEPKATRSTAAIADAPTGAQLTLSMLRAMGPIFRAALVYPGPTAAPTAWALAIKTMSDVSAQVAGQLALTRTEELDVAWARRELHPAVAVIVSEHWLHSVIKMQRVESVSDIKLSAEDLLPGISAALRAVDECGNQRLAEDRSALAGLLPSLALLLVDAQAYQALLESDAVGLNVPELSVDKYMQAIAAAVVEAVHGQDARAKIGGAVHGAEFRESLLQSATGIIVKAAQTAV
ncbi:hypothetical protein QE400_000022 [Xanthomonas sacchari]|uniref:hypothetical protein n=1 Tax=Xanthomonas sacchari TaxID=56458 RepID=UPI0027863646|nr:hypothetical protein [Xanthomonas sacchari]MDQ1090609.1 hypothetical protein [Xanthomonas sacchari]